MEIFGLIDLNQSTRTYEILKLYLDQIAIIKASFPDYIYKLLTNIKFVE